MGQKLDIMKGAMDADDEIRINLASSYASLSNYHKYLIGQSLMLNRYDLVQYKRGDENNFKNWVNGETDRQDSYGSILDDIDNLYSGFNDTDKFISYLNFAVLGSSVTSYALQYLSLARRNGSF